MPDWSQVRRVGPARLLQPHAETYAGIALATSAAHAANWVKDIPSPQSDAILWVCVVTLTFGFVWAAFRLAFPRSVTRPPKDKR
jgi:hypothetical protein